MQLKFNEMFEKVKKEDILQGIKDFKGNGLPNGFGPSSTYDLAFDGKTYPPPAIMAYAYFHAEGKHVEPGFRVGQGSECFEVYEKLGFEITIKEKAMNIIDVKDEFATWLLKNAPNSYKSYLGTTKDDILFRLNELDAFYPEKDLFKIKDNNPVGIRNFITKMISQRRERIKNLPFYEYDKENGNGIPKAVLGRQNYIKFLNDKFKVRVTKNDRDIQKFYDLKNEFLKEWPLERLEKMAIEEYTNLEKTSFCYWLEQKTQSIGGIRGGSSYKFGIYKMANNSITKPAKNRTNDSGYAWHLKYGQTKEMAFKTIKEIVVKIARLSLDNDLKSLDNIDLGDAVKWKIAFLYSDFHVINMFNRKSMTQILFALGVDLPSQALISELNKLILDQKPENEDFFEYSIRLWNTFSGIIDVDNERIGEFKGWLKNIYRKHNGVALSDGSIYRYINGLKWIVNDIKERKFLDGTSLLEFHDSNDLEDIMTSYFELSEIIKLNERGNNMYSNSMQRFIEFNEYEENTNKNIKYWLFAPGEKAFAWDEFYNNNFMALGWDKLGDLSSYKNKKEIYNSLFKHYGGEGDKKNDVAANFDFLNEMNIGDIIIVKTARNRLLGYGVVSSDYYFDNTRDDYKQCRKVDWKQRGNWTVDHNLVLKTLTDVTPYGESHGFNKYYEYLMSRMLEKEDKLKINRKIKPCVNQILYGPPGTGKTFFLKEQLFEKYTLKEESISKEKYFEEVITNLTWWQVITLALIENGKSKVSDILDNRWVATKASLSESKNVRATIWGTLQMHTIEESTSVNYKQRQVPLIFDKTEDKSWELLEVELKERAPEIYKIKDEVDNFQVNAAKSIKHYDFVTFHQSFSYEDFIEGIKPVFPENDEEASDLGYTIEDGVFKRLCLRAKNDPENRYAIFIDEINRGNVSAIFGELITLIETDKRSGAKNEMSVKLPYSKMEFSVPSNMDIYGTMNTADRSVEALDTALRRRFEFVEKMPDYKVIDNEEVKGVKLSKVLKVINKRIELLIDRDHTIGHSYFVGVDTPEKLTNAFNNKIIPLLQEYFYGDYGKIGLVLGNGFVKEKDNRKLKFSTFKYEGKEDFVTPTYKLIKVDESTVLNAVEQLLETNES